MTSGTRSNTATKPLCAFETSGSTLALLGGGEFMLGSITTVFYSFSALWYTANGYSPWQIGLVLALMSISDAVGMLGLAAVLDTLRMHNLGISVLLVCAGILRLFMLPAHTFMGFPVVAALDITADPLVLLAFSVLDAVVVFAVVKKDEFPPIKVACNVGAALSALLMGWCVDAWGTFDVIFYVHCSLCIAGALYWFFAHRFIPSVKADLLSETLDYRAVLRHTLITCNRHSMLVLVALLVAGMACGMYQAFRLLILQELHASTTFLGGMETVSSLSEIPVYLMASKLIRACGSMGTLCLSLSITSLRLLIMGMIEIPWHGICAEILSGFTFALPFSLGVLYFSARIPEELKGSVISFVAVLIVGIGFGLGAFIGGIVGGRIGKQLLFVYASASLFCFALIIGSSQLCDSSASQREDNDNDNILSQAALA